MAEAAPELIAQLPRDLAVHLQDQGLAVRLPPIRAGAPTADVILGGLTVASALVTLIQTPTALRQLAELMREWARRNPADVHLSVRSDRGSITLNLHEDSSTDDILAALRLLKGPKDTDHDTP